ncbi:hypothetical protein AAFF_G00074480 [Aldrovandia affinis]|uniref:Uncharacterized protein n=1 Tax=Aldrovandia affinis TaxID=143900 RepID=A0AAD7RYJ0_9TELE|nr:hypothetical protein AAFF_G00074480 [Aldrovandia affinis]
MEPPQLSMVPVNLTLGDVNSWRVHRHYPDLHRSGQRFPFLQSLRSHARTETRMAGLAVAWPRELPTNAPGRGPARTATPARRAFRHAASLTSFRKRRGELRGDIFGEVVRFPDGFGGSSSRCMCSLKVRMQESGSGGVSSLEVSSLPDMLAAGRCSAWYPSEAGDYVIQGRRRVAAAGADRLRACSLPPLQLGVFAAEHWLTARSSS